MDRQYNLFLAETGWVVYEKETLRVVEVDGVPQIGLKFAPAVHTATLLNIFKKTPDQDPRPKLRPMKRILAAFH